MIFRAKNKASRCVVKRCQIHHTPCQEAGIPRAFKTLTRPLFDLNYKLASKCRLAGSDTRPSACCSWVSAATHDSAATTTTSQRPASTSTRRRRRERPTPSPSWAPRAASSSEGQLRDLRLRPRRGRVAPPEQRVARRGEPGAVVGAAAAAAGTARRPPADVAACARVKARNCRGASSRRRAGHGAASRAASAGPAPRAPCACCRR